MIFRYSIQLAVAALFAVSIVGGCEPTRSPAISLGRVNVSKQHLPVVAGSEFEMRVQRSERPLLVEFGVDIGCHRCDQMRPEIFRLAREFEDRVDVVRVHFNLNRQLAAQFGATICPSYVLFDQGQVVAKRSFPTSADLLATDFRSILTDNKDGE